MNDNGETKIDEKFMNEGQLFGLRWSQGMTFLEITGWEEVKVDPLSSVGPIPADSSTSFDRLDYSDDDVLYMDKGEKKVIHASIGMTPGYIRRYTNYPEGEVRLRKFPNLGMPRPGDPFGYVDGSQSPYDAPTDVEELFVPPGVHLDFAFHNPDNTETEPLLNIKTRVYDVRPLDPSDSEDRNHIKRVVTPGSPMPIHPVGSVRRQADYDIRDHWGVRPISREEAKEV
jgi:hypothetical protein